MPGYLQSTSNAYEFTRDCKERPWPLAENDGVMDVCLGAAINTCMPVSIKARLPSWSLKHRNGCMCTCLIIQEICIWPAVFVISLDSYSKARSTLRVGWCSAQGKFPVSVRVEQLGSHRTNFHEVSYISIFWKSIEKVLVLLKSDKNDGYFIWRPICIFYHISQNS